MASLSIVLPGKVSDRQFIGDLMNLFERRKVKCGNIESLDTFAAVLESNHGLRSDLFTLCTAISHMAAEDLTGEELLVLVAKALGGPQIPKCAAPREIPESLCKAFLDGYEAWGNRTAFAIEQPVMWPEPRKTETTEEFEGDYGASEARIRAEGSRTIQQALQVARARSAFGVLSQRADCPVPDIDQLTISELKKLMEEIEHRVNCIEPQEERARAHDPRQTVLSFEPETEATVLGTDQPDGKDDALAVAAEEPVEPPVTGLEGKTPEALAESLVAYSRTTDEVTKRGHAGALLGIAGVLLVTLAWGGVHVFRAAHLRQKTSQIASGPKQTAKPSTNRIAVAPAVQVAAAKSGKPNGQTANPASAVFKKQIAEQSTPTEPASVVDAQPDQPADAGLSQGILPVRVAAAAAGASTTIIGYATKPVRAEAASGISGTVMVEVSISKQGTVSDARVISGPPALAAAAIKTVKQWRFKPSVVNGTPTEVTTTLGVYFKGE